MCATWVLLASDAPVRIANPIYAEVVLRELAWATQERLVQETAWYVGPDCGLDVEKLLAAFQAFYREHSEHWLGRFDYREAGPQLLLQAFLQRVVNGGGRIEREYGSPLAKQALERIGALHRIAPRAAMQARPAQFITGTKPKKTKPDHGKTQAFE